MRAFVTILFALLLTSCSSPPPDALLAIIKKIRLGPLTVCLTVDGQDPSLEMMDRLTSAGLRVVPGSSCRETVLGYVPVDGSKAVSLRVYDFRRTVPWRATAKYTLSSTSLSATGFTVTLEQVDGIWIVTSGDMAWIT